MGNKFKKWKQIDSNYWINNEINWVVKEISREDDEQWVIIDDKGMMLSCEWKETKEDCMDEVEFILSQETKFGFFTLKN